MLSHPAGTGHHPPEEPHAAWPWTVAGIAVTSCISHGPCKIYKPKHHCQTAKLWFLLGWDMGLERMGVIPGLTQHHSEPGVSRLELEQRLSLLPWAGTRHSIDSERPCLTHPGAGLSLSKGKLALNPATRLWRPYGAGRGVGASPDLYCREGSTADPVPAPRGGCSQAAQVVPWGSLLNKTIKSLSPGFSVSMCSQVS